MYNGAEFRKFADKCVEQANKRGLSKTDQTDLLRMAAKWLELADDADRMNLLSEALETVADEGSSRFH